MNRGIAIGDERSSDFDSIGEVTIAAFKTLPLGSQVPQGTVIFHEAFKAEDNH